MRIPTGSAQLHDVYVIAASGHLSLLEPTTLGFQSLKIEAHPGVQRATHPVGHKHGPLHPFALPARASHTCVLPQKPHFHLEELCRVTPPSTEGQEMWFLDEMPTSVDSSVQGKDKQERKKVTGTAVTPSKQ